MVFGLRKNIMIVVRFWEMREDRLGKRKKKRKIEV